MKRHEKVNSLADTMPFPWNGVSFSSSALMFLSILLMGLSSFKPHIIEPVRGQVVDIFSPVLFMVSIPFQHAAIFFHDVTGFAQLQADNLRLEQENTKLREWYQTALLLNSENKSLRELLNLKVDPQYDNVSARVISDSGNTYVKSLLVSVGKDDGVTKGSAVLSGDGLLGRIVEVGDASSRILLVTDINSRVPIMVEDTGQHGIMAGKNTSIPALIHLPQDSDVLEGSRLITSGYGGIYPHGLPVGKVIIISGEVKGVALFSDFDTIQIVRILQEDIDATQRPKSK